MFELKNIEKKVSLDCSVEGYQFPDSPKDDWCLLKVILQHNGSTFEKVDPALETEELVRMYQWFECLSKNMLPRFACLSFTEPCIDFEFLAYNEGIVRMSIGLSNELKPSFELEQLRSKSNEWSIVFELDDSNFSRILKGIDAAIKKYPTRSEM
jgi:hypothetical protein